MTIRLAVQTLALLTVLAAAPAQADQLPPFFTVPADLKAEEGAVQFEDYGEAEFPIEGKAEHIQAGRHWSADMQFASEAEDLDNKTLWPKIKPALQKGGWTMVAEYATNPPHATVRLQRKGQDAWAHLWLMGARDVRVQVVEVVPQTMQHTFKTPAAKPEVIDDNTGDFPYLPPLPGSKPTGGGRDPRAMEMRLPGNQEPTQVGAFTISRNYEVSPRLSNLQFALVVAQALRAVGWQVIQEGHGIAQSDSFVTAHYTQQGRDIWLYAHHGTGDYSFAIADAGAIDLAAELKKTCRVALRGVFFDFDKATLRPESESVLGRARDAIKAAPGLDLEVQGHTDGQGTDAYNDKLSDARAHAVLTWLTAHGAPAAQLTAKGYGKRVPIAPNASDEGRAKNRRVELVCKKGAKPAEVAPE